MANGTEAQSDIRPVKLSPSRGKFGSSGSVEEKAEGRMCGDLSSATTGVKDDTDRGCGRSGLKAYWGRGVTFSFPFCKNYKLHFNLIKIVTNLRLFWFLVNRRGRG